MTQQAFDQLALLEVGLRSKKVGMKSSTRGPVCVCVLFLLDPFPFQWKRSVDRTVLREYFETLVFEFCSTHLSNRAGPCLRPVLLSPS